MLILLAFFRDICTEFPQGLLMLMYERIMKSITTHVDAHHFH